MLPIKNKYILFYLLILWNGTILSSQNRFDTLRTVKMTAVADLLSESITIHWTDDADDNTYHLYKKLPTEDTWGSAIFSSGNQDTFYLDQEIEKGALYEYRILKETGDSLGYGYLYSGLDYKSPYQQGDILLLLDAAAQNTVAENIEIYLDLLRSEGWNPRLEIVSSDATVSEVKAIILDEYETLNNLKTVLLLGNIAVPHAGNINPDAHNDHKGAWPADVYYGDMDGVWTDESVNNTSSAYPRIHNVPGDGKFDQDYIPGEIELAVGRLDFSELPIFDLNEYELLDGYLEKNIAFRTGAYRPRQKAVFKNRNSWKEGLGQNAIRNFVPLVSNDSITYEDFFDAFSDSFLWSYGGSSGSMTSSNSLGNINTYANNNFQAVFTAYFGSYYGDYDFENNYLRTVLASGKVLSTAWVGAPNWYFHPMGMGLDLGFCTRLTQNNQDLYYAGFFPKSVTINLLGDPTLSAFIVKAPQNLVADQQENYINLNWSTVADDLLGYQVYRKTVEEDYFTLLNELPTVDTFFVDSCVAGNTEFEYMVSAVKREITPSGSYINRSNGPILYIESQPNTLPEANFELTWESGILSSLNQSVDAFEFQWILPDGTTTEEEDFVIPLESNGTITVTLIASNLCFSDTLEQTLLVNSTTRLTMEKIITIFPNPMSDLLILNTKQTINNLSLFNIFGKPVKKFGLLPSGKHELAVSALPPGTYILEISIGAVTFYHKILTLKNK